MSNKNAVRAAQNDPRNPSMAVLVKLGSVVVHVEELFSPDGDPAFDRGAIEGLLVDPELRAWLAGMDGMALLPKKRKP